SAVGCALSLRLPFVGLSSARPRALHSFLHDALPICRRVELVRGLRVASPPLPACEQPLRVIPERIDLYGLSPTRCDDPVVDLCVHPRELVADLALSEQPILGIDTDPEARAVHVMRHDVAQYREQPLERIGVATRPDVPVDRMEEP